MKSKSKQSNTFMYKAKKILSSTAGIVILSLVAGVYLASAGWYYSGNLLLPELSFGKKAGVNEVSASRNQNCDPAEYGDGVYDGNVSRVRYEQHSEVVDNKGGIKIAKPKSVDKVTEVATFRCVAKDVPRTKIVVGKNGFKTLVPMTDCSGAKTSGRYEQCKSKYMVQNSGWEFAGWRVVPPIDPQNLRGSVGSLNVPKDSSNIGFSADIAIKNTNALNNVTGKLGGVSGSAGAAKVQPVVVEVDEEIEKVSPSRPAVIYSSNTARRY